MKRRQPRNKGKPLKLKDLKDLFKDRDQETECNSVADDSDSDNEHGFGEEDVCQLDECHIGFFCKVSKSSVTELIKLLSRTADKVIKKALLQKLDQQKGYGGNDKTQDTTESVATVYLHVDSPGGCLHSGLRAYDYIRRLSCKVRIVTIGEGCVASAATLIALAGNSRLATKNATFLYHQLTSMLYGKYADIKDEKQACDMLMRKLYTIYVRHSNMTKDEVKELLGREKLLTSKQCLKLGFLDGLYE